MKYVILNSHYQFANYRTFWRTKLSHLNRSKIVLGKSSDIDNCYYKCTILGEKTQS